MRAAVVALAVLSVWGCTRRPPAEPPHPAYMVGAPYQSAGIWLYPQESFRLEATGLASVLPDRPGLTANGEARDPAAFTAAHATLQLPAIARVTNLETGRQVLVRINDRGPEGVHRLLGLNRAAAAQLGIAPGGTARIRLQVEDGASQALRDALSGGPSLVSAAPREAVTTESLAPPAGIGQSTRRRSTPFRPEATATTAITTAAEPARDEAPSPGQLWIVAGVFGQESFARAMIRRMADVPAQVRRTGQGRAPAFQVRAGPYDDVAAADNALDRALANGVTDARIVVE